MSRELSNEEAAIRDRAMVFARKNGKGLAADRTDVGIYPSDPNPVSVFMAGSPGIGGRLAVESVAGMAWNTQYSAN